jgi:hypothetical protein
VKSYLRRRSNMLNNKRKFDPLKEDLEKLVWELPTLHVAKLFGVSDKAVDKRCRLLGIQKPGRGYWAKLKAAQKISLIEAQRIS